MASPARAYKTKTRSESHGLIPMVGVDGTIIIITLLFFLCSLLTISQPLLVRFIILCGNSLVLRDHHVRFRPPLPPSCTGWTNRRAFGAPDQTGQQRDS